MREHRASFTAAWVAAWRGLGQVLGDGQLVEDPYGVRFAGWWAALVEAAARRGAGRAVLRRLPPVQNWAGYMQVRTHVIDQALAAFVADGGRQVVILGAGYDCRAARLPALAGVRVFEVDHPATAARKRAVLASLGVAPPTTYLAWDFEQRPLADVPAALAAVGLDRRVQTFTIWEGVTMYLSAAAIDATFAAVAGLGSAGSQLCWNYLVRDQLDRPRAGARLAAALVRRVGEPFRFGWDPMALPAYLEARGYALVWDLDCQAAAAALLPDRVARQVSAFGRRIALATTPG